MLQVMPTAVPVWPITEDAPDLETIVADGAKTIAAQAVLIDEYQTVLNNAQNPLPGTAATAVASASGTSLTVGAPVTGTIAVGATVADATTATTTVPAGTTILGQISGTTGGAGVYLTSQVTTALSTSLTFTPPPPASTWPIPGDAPTLQQIQLAQTGLIRLQTSLTQQYLDLLNISQTPIPPTGP